MKKEEYILITFQSTHHAIGAEDIFQRKALEFKTIPTPREVSHSCGLALLFSIELLEKVKEVIGEEKVNIDSLYKFTKNNRDSKAEKII